MIAVGGGIPEEPPPCNKITAKWQGVWIFMPDCPSAPAQPPANPSPVEPNPAPVAPP